MPWVALFSNIYFTKNSQIFDWRVDNPIQLGGSSIDKFYKPIEAG